MTGRHISPASVVSRRVAAPFSSNFQGLLRAWVFQGVRSCYQSVLNLVQLACFAEKCRIIIYG